MRRDVKKFLFVGNHQQQKAFFKDAQQAGIIHFIEQGPKKGKELPQDIENTIQAIKVLRSLPTMTQENLANLSDADGITQKILNFKKEIEKLAEEMRVAKLEKARVEIFGNFSVEEIEEIHKETGREVQFFFAKKDLFHGDHLPDHFFLVGSDHGLDYFVSISDKPVDVPNMIEMKIHHPLGQLNKQIQEADKKTHVFMQELKDLQKYHHFLHKSLISKMNKYHLAVAETSVEYELDGALFAVMGWVPADKIETLNELCQKNGVSFEEIAVEESDTVPTFLENQGIARIGEDLVGIYDTPSHTDKDPSLWVLLSFAVFFALIVNDGGYGFIFLAIALYVNYKYRPAKALGKRLMKLFYILCASCIAWGLLSNQFFSIDLPFDSPLRKISVLNWLAHQKAAYHLEQKDAVYQDILKKYPEAKQPETASSLLQMGKENPDGSIKAEVNNQFYSHIMMELALLIGAIHITLSMCRYLRSSWAFVGWILCIWGAYLYFPAYLNATSIFNYVFGVSKEVASSQGLLMMEIGIVTAVVLSIIQNKWTGSIEFLNSIQIFSDIMSYLRLYALGLAGGIMGATINDIASGIGPFLGAVLLFIGHAFNITLAVMGGIIHGLRLNFLEWYHYSFQGGGKNFRPLKEIEID